jgi:hypothetical protein
LVVITHKTPLRFKILRGFFFVYGICVKPDRDKKDMYGQEYGFSPAFACIQAVC